MKEFEYSSNLLYYLHSEMMKEDSKEAKKITSRFQENSYYHVFINLFNFCENKE